MKNVGLTDIRTYYGLKNDAHGTPGEEEEMSGIESNFWFLLDSIERYIELQRAA